MKVQQAMTGNVKYIPMDTTLTQASQMMRDQDCGFLPIGNDSDERLLGVVTDRDIVIRGIAEGQDPNSATVDSMKTDKVLYCFRDDDLQDVAKNMKTQQVYRLVVLDDPQSKQLCGVISLGDIAREGMDQLTGEAATGIAS